MKWCPPTGGNLAGPRGAPGELAGSVSLSPRHDDGDSPTAPAGSDVKPAGYTALDGLPSECWGRGSKWGSRADGVAGTARFYAGSEVAAVIVEGRMEEVAPRGFGELSRSTVLLDPGRGPDGSAGQRLRGRPRR